MLPDCAAMWACSSAISRVCCLPLPALLPRLPLLSHLLVKRPVQLPNAGVCRAVLAAEERRRQLLIAALIADRMLLSVVTHIRRQPEATDASEAQRHGQRRAPSSAAGGVAAADCAVAAVAAVGAAVGAVALVSLSAFTAFNASRTSFLLLLPQLTE